MKRFALYAFLSFISTKIYCSAPGPDEIKEIKQTKNEHPIFSYAQVSALLEEAKALLGDKYSQEDALSDGETEDEQTLRVDAPDLHRAAFSCKRSSLEAVKTLLAHGADIQSVCIRTDIEVMCEKCVSFGGGVNPHPTQPHCNHPPMEQTALQIAQNRLYDYNEKLQCKRLTAEQYTSMPTIYTGYESVGIKGVDLKKIIPLFQAKVALLKQAEQTKK